MTTTPPPRIKLTPALVIGAGGTGVSAIRHLKRRVRLAWPQGFSSEMPNMIQFYGLDSVSYENRPEQEFLRQDEYGFLGGYDPNHFLKQKHMSVESWWDFPDDLLPKGVVHMGARQIRALGRLSLFHSYAEVNAQIEYKLNQVITISAAAQATRAGFDIPLETSGRTVFIVSSICGGTGAGCFLDLATMVRRLADEKQQSVTIVGVLVLPSAFEAVLPSRQITQTRANAIAAMKELESFWYVRPGRAFSVRYPGDTQPYMPNNPPFSEIYLIGREGRSFMLNSIDDIAQQIAHFVYLRTINNIAGPLNEMIVNYDRKKQYYSSFAVGGINLPEWLVSGAQQRALQKRYLLNLVEDNRAKLASGELNKRIDTYLSERTTEATDLARSVLKGASEEQYDDRVKELRKEWTAHMLRWLFLKIIPEYGLGSVSTVYDAFLKQIEDGRKQNVQDKKTTKEALNEQRRGENADQSGGLFGGLLRALSRNPQEAAKEAEDAEAKRGARLLLVGDTNNQQRLFDFLTEALSEITTRTRQFQNEARNIAATYEQRQNEDFAFGSKPKGDVPGSHKNYYDMEIDPRALIKEANDAFCRRWEILLGELNEIVAPEQILKPSGDDLSVMIPDAIQLLGLIPSSGLPRSTSFAEAFEVGTTLGRNSKPSFRKISESDFKQMVATLVEKLVSNHQKEVMSLLSLFEEAKPKDNPVMYDGLRRVVEHLMPLVKPFWGAAPFPDEQKLEFSRKLCMVGNPEDTKIASQIFKQYVNRADASAFGYVGGANPYRLDVVAIEHGARPTHIAELHRCKTAYDGFNNSNGVDERAQFHLKAAYVNLDDPLK